MRAQVMQMFGDMDQPFRSATLKEYTASSSFPRTIPLVTHHRAQLPTEILTIIFALVARQHASECLLNGDDDRPDTWMAWVPLMLVCRRWRDIGISTPWLWRRIAITNDLESKVIQELERPLDSESKGCKDVEPQDVVPIASYNWTNDQEPTIIVPGTLCSRRYAVSLTK